MIGGWQSVLEDPRKERVQALRWGLAAAGHG